MEETDLEKPETKEKWANYERHTIDGHEIKLTSYFDTKYDYQDENLEERYKEFKETRDHYLLDDVPEEKTLKY